MVGVFGQGGTGNSDGVLGFSNGTGAGVHGVARSSTAGVGLAGHFDGNVVINGDLTASTKHAAVPFPDGSRRLLYAMESPESWFEDFGMSELVDGQAIVTLDPGFAAIVTGDVYHVFISEYGDNNALYVTDRINSSFTVRAKGSSTANSTFSYRIVSKRKDIAGPRLPKLAVPTPIAA